MIKGNSDMKSKIESASVTSQGPSLNSSLVVNPSLNFKRQLSSTKKKAIVEELFNEIDERKRKYIDIRLINL